MTIDPAPRILVVEDEPGIALALADDLRLEGYDVTVTGDGTAAIGIARDGRFALILLDIMIEGKDGFEVCRELRRGGASTPIIMLTARTQESEKVLALDSGADDYVTKPFGPRELRSRIAAVLRRTHAGATPETPTARVGDAEIDFERAEIRRAGVTHPMTSLEFKVLRTFMRTPGRILTRERLIELAWGRDTFVTDRVVDNHIGSLRKKLEEDAAVPRHLVNVRGLGYRFDL